MKNTKKNCKKRSLFAVALVAVFTFSTALCFAQSGGGDITSPTGIVMVSIYNTGNTISDNTGWYNSNSNGKTHEVGKKPANKFGLHDMHGNVWEWCWDWYGGDYPSGAQTDPLGASSGLLRVLRGGGWDSSGQYLRSASRYGDYPDSRTTASRSATASVWCAPEFCSKGGIA